MTDKSLAETASESQVSERVAEVVKKAATRVS